MSRTSLSKPRQRQITVLALSALIIGIGGGLAWQNDPSLFAGLQPFRSSSSSSSMSKEMLERVEFGPPDTDLMFGVHSVGARLIDGQIKINERYVLETVQRTRSKEEIVYLSKSTGTPISRIPARETVTNQVKPKAKNAIWIGPVSEAQFVHEMAGGVDTLRDRRGSILWTNAAEAAKADLVLQSTASGEARLLGKKGTLLWQGTLPAEEKPSPRTASPPPPISPIPPIPPRRKKQIGHSGDSGDSGQSNQSNQSNPSVHSNRSRSSQYASHLVHTYQIVEYGIHINGVNGQFTIADNNQRHLWSGTLPKRPVILLRRGHDFSLMGANRSVGGMDRVAEIDLTVEKGEVTISDTTRGTTGTRSVSLLKIAKKTILPEGEPFRVFVDLPRRACPSPIASAGSSMAFTFKDGSGKTIGTKSVSGGNSSPVASSL